MEPPRTSSTSILKIDHLSRVSYTVFAPSTSCPGQASPFETQAFNSVRNAERSLKIDGIPAISHYAQSSLWVFQVDNIVTPSVVPEPQAPGEKWKHVFSRLRDEFGLHERSSGIILSSSLSCPPTTKPNDPLTPHSAVIDLTLDDDDAAPEEPEETSPYQNFISAVLAVISFHLSLREGFTPLNCRTLVSPSSLPPTLSEDNSGNRQEAIISYIPVTVPEIVAPLTLQVDTYMSSSGSLIIAPHSQTQPAVRRLSTANLCSSSLKDREVFLAPWGEWGRLCQPSDLIEESIRLRSEECWKTCIRSYLQDYGILSTTTSNLSNRTSLQEAVEDGSWHYVEIWLPSFSDLNMVDTYQILWPEALLFLRDTEGDKVEVLPASTDVKNRDVLERIYNSPEYVRLLSGMPAMLRATLNVANRITERDLGVEWWDIESSVAWAIKWYEGREERAKLMAASDANKAQVASLDGIASSPAVSAVTDKGKGKLLAEQRNLPGPGGVYPTPPDAASAGSTHQGFPQATSTPGTGFATSGNEMDVEWTGGQTTVSEKDTGGVVGGETAELFGEGMDEIEFMGVTEDDFDFFDQPDQEFGDVDAAGDGGMDLDVPTQPEIQPPMDDIDMITAETDELRMTTPLPPPPTFQPPLPPVSSSSQPSRLENTEERPPQIVDDGPRQNTNISSIRTPPLSPKRAFKLLIPGYSPSTEFTFTPPSTTGNIKTPAASSSTLAPEKPSSESNLKRRPSLYAPFAFSEAVDMTDRKYAPGGIFYIEEAQVKEERRPTDPTGPDKPRLKRKKAEQTSESLPTMSPDALLPPPPAEVSNKAEDDPQHDMSDWNDEESESSDADDSSEYDESVSDESHGGTQNGSALTKAGFFFPLIKMKGDNSNLLGSTPAAKDPGTTAAITELDVELLGPSPWDRLLPDPFNPDTLFDTFSSKALSTAPLAMHGELEFSTVAGIVGDQMAGWMLSVWNGKNETTAEDDYDEPTVEIMRRKYRDHNLVVATVKSIFKGNDVGRCDLETYAAIADTVQEPPPLPPPPPLGRLGLPPKPNPSRGKPKDDAPQGPEIFHIPPPHVRLQRGDNPLEILPPALHFWETFSLAPISGGKNVISLCLYPAAPAMEEGAEFLMERIASSYEAGRFGAHVRMNIEGVAKNGLIPVELPSGTPRTYEATMKVFGSYLEALGPMLAHGIADEQVNIVTYVINPFNHPNSIVDIATGFYRMRTAYDTAIRLIPAVKPNHLALQIVPASFVAHKLGLVMRVNVVHRLAVEVYTRCVQTDPGTNFLESKAAFSAPIHLTRPLPRSIEFKLVADPSPALLKENQLLHVTYSQSIDERWVAAAWSDSSGEIQKTTLLNLGRKNHNYLRPFTDILTDLWKMTTDLIRHPAVRWRICIAKVASSIPDDEIVTWRNLSSQHDHVSAVYICAADLHPSLSINENLPKLRMEQLGFPPSSTSGGHGFGPSPSGMPANTPTPGGGPVSILSPDATAHTPGGGHVGDSTTELDTDAELLDKADECWAVMMAHALPMGVLSERRFKASGMLLRRGVGPGWKVLCTISVVDQGGKEALREILKGWRGLSVIGGFQSGCHVPWGARWCDTVVNAVARVL